MTIYALRYFIDLSLAAWLTWAMCSVVRWWQRRRVREVEAPEPPVGYRLVEYPFNYGEYPDL